MTFLFRGCERGRFLSGANEDFGFARFFVGRTVVFGAPRGKECYERQKKLLGMILSYDVLCRDAIAKGASAQELFQIPAREQIGRAKSVPAEEYAAVYDQIQSDMEQQIAAIAAKGGDDE